MQGYRFFITFLLILDIYYSVAQKRPENKYGVAVLFDKNEFFSGVARDSSKAMVELKQLIPNITYELRYSGRMNFMKKRMYPKNTTYTFLRSPAAAALRLVQLDLNGRGYAVKVWDAYRPYSVTVDFWELVKDERYVADPGKGSGHNRGIAVDLTLIELSSGKELDMGTGFDNFTDTAHHDFQNLSPAVLSNRRLLKTTMEKYGFVSFPSEWWHYSLQNSSSFEILDIPFKTLKKVPPIQR